MPVGLLLLAACAAGTGTQRASGEQVTVQVQNDLLPRSAVVIRAVSGEGARSLIGSLSPGRTQTMSYRQPAFRGSYRFVAESDAGQQIVSMPIVLEPEMTLVWALRNNTLTISS